MQPANKPVHHPTLRNVLQAIWVAVTRGGQASHRWLFNAITALVPEEIDLEQPFDPTTAPTWITSLSFFLQRFAGELAGDDSLLELDEAITQFLPSTLNIQRGYTGEHIVFADIQALPHAVLRPDECRWNPLSHEALAGFDDLRNDAERIRFLRERYPYARIAVLPPVED